MSKANKTSRIYLGGGCFWGKEYHLSRVQGVSNTAVGFMGGQVSHPTYQQVCTKTTGHAEVVAVDYDPQQRSTFDLLIEFFSIHDPRIDRRDKGGQYRSAIFYTDDNQHQAAQRLINCLTQKGHHISTELSPATDFWLADERHQQYCTTKGLTPRAGKGLREDLQNVREKTHAATD